MKIESNELRQELNKLHSEMGWVSIEEVRMMNNKRGGKPPLFSRPFGQPLLTRRPANVRAEPISHLDTPHMRFFSDFQQPYMAEETPETEAPYMASYALERAGRDRAARCFRPVLHMRIFFYFQRPSICPICFPKLGKPTGSPLYALSFCAKLGCSLAIFKKICYNIKKDFNTDRPQQQTPIDGKFLGKHV